MVEDALPSGIRGGDSPYTRRRLTVAQAADQLGGTVDAVRARIKRETIDHVREGGRVMLDAAQGETSNDQDCAQYDDQPPETGPDYRDELVEELRDRVRALEEANSENRRIIAVPTSRIPHTESGCIVTPRLMLQLAFRAHDLSLALRSSK